VEGTNYDASGKVIWGKGTNYEAAGNIIWRKVQIMEFQIIFGEGYKL
jgi:hypothetical protein